MQANPIEPGFSSVATVSEVTREYLAKEHLLLINGEWVAGEQGDSIDTFDPATGEKIATVAIGHQADIDKAVAAANAAFISPWSKLSHFERAKYLSKLARLIEDHAETFTELEILDNGMPRFISALTIQNISEMFDYYAGAAQRIEGTTTNPPRHITEVAEALTYTVKEPVGVAGQIVPWNVPISTAVLKLAPALAAGCTVVVKPSEETPLSILLLGELIIEAGFPPGVVNIVNGYGYDAGQHLAEHPQVDKISFTGSTATGRKVIAAAMGNLKKVSLELGGKSPVVIMPDADLSLVVPGVAMATFFLQGQNCMAGTRIFIHESIHDECIEQIAAFARQFVIGHGLKPETFIGPLISKAHRDKVYGYIQKGIEEGATLVCGGNMLAGEGNFIEPTIFTNCTPDMAIVKEEIFGPVMAVQRFNTTDLDEIAAMANNTEYGLSGSVWTTNLSTAHSLVARIRAGQVSINCHGAIGTNIPFGGYGQSGWGREFGQEGLDAYLETKAVTARL
ncbi:aldehyde dehydrogenase family protein [Alteromonas lipolytica]|uniref:Aldehyde dehydrogenase n=1 Tax=Alteromonas lipolytica TaxID=1856405 RepID=A0A1E8FBP5_9ALTE|nr:aldehyde dehydrogenase family protein [Alteromonas lipolytica]OFI33357.1 aldehyde dehydrogenase [Alteromonas lipolytica]GGF60441.1 aldehyde dehydrogenase [Alteromonas lipolytica]